MLNLDELRRQARVASLASQRLNLTIEREMFRLELAQKGKEISYANQKQAAIDCRLAYNAGALVVILVAQPGTGKTGTVHELMYDFATHIDDNACVKSEDVHILSGMNDKEWNKQFEKNVIPSFRKNIVHRGKLAKHKTELSNLRNGFIATDECQYASGIDMTLSTVLQGTGLTNVATIAERNIKLLDISATPDAVLHDMESWGDKAKIVRLMPGPSYKGFQVMLDEGRLIQAPDLSSPEEALALLQKWDTRYASTTKKWFPMRINNTKWLECVFEAITTLGWDFIHHDSTQHLEQDAGGNEITVDDRMNNAPLKHTIIFIKGYWRASKRINRRHVGGTYEQVPKSTNVTASAQNLPARFCDNFEYDADEPLEVRPTHYCDKQAIKMYLVWFDNGCDYRAAEYQSAAITSNDGKVRARESKYHYSNISELDPVIVEVQTNTRVPVICQVTPEFVAEFLKARGQNRVTMCRNELLSQESGDEEFREFINSRSHTCSQATAPKQDTNRSYKIHIQAVVDASSNSRRLAVMDLNEELRGTACWQVFIDRVNSRLCVLWQYAV